MNHVAYSFARAASNVIFATRNRFFGIIDKKEQSRIEMGVRDTNDPQMLFRDSSGVIRLAIGLAEDSPRITFYTPQGNVCMTLGCLDSEGNLVLGDRQGNPILIVSNNGVSHLANVDMEGGVEHGG